MSIPTGQVIDVLSYEGSIVLATITGIQGTVNLVKGTAVPVETSDSPTVNGFLRRFPNGINTDNASIDWSFRTTPTPGAPNQL